MGSGIVFIHRGNVSGCGAVEVARRAYFVDAGKGTLKELTSIFRNPV